MIIVDTGAWVGLADLRDQYHFHRQARFQCLSLVESPSVYQSLSHDFVNRLLKFYYSSRQLTDCISQVNPMTLAETPMAEGSESPLTPLLQRGGLV